MRGDFEDFYPLSPTQEGMLFHSLYAPASSVYRDQSSYAFEGELDRVAFERAWQGVLQRHPALRTAFVWHDLDEPVQVVFRRPVLPFQYLDWSGVPASEQRDRLTGFLEADRERAFDLSVAPLMRLTLIRLGELRHHVVWSVHHILLDGWSGALVMREVMALYRAYSRGERPALPASRPYKDYVKWLRQRDLSVAEEFWTAALRGFSTPTVLGVERQVPLEGLGVGDRSVRLSVEMTERLTAFARQNRLTLNTVVQGAWALLLSRYSSTSDVVFGATVSGRPTSLAGAEGIVGVMINTMPVRVAIPEVGPVVSWLQECQGRLARFLEHQHAPLVRIHSWSESPRGLFDNILIFENFPAEPADEDADVHVSEQRYMTRTNYSLSILVLPGAELELRALYERGRFDDAVITRLLGHLKHVLEQLVADRDTQLEHVSLLTDEEREYLLQGLNEREADPDPPAGSCVVAMFEEQAARRRDAVAVSFDDRSMSYGQLDDRSNQLARHLQLLGAGKGALVGVCVERSLEMIVALLGVMKAGAAYVPLDPDFPAERLALMAGDGGLTLILATESSEDSVPESAAEVLCLDRDWERVDRHTSDGVALAAGPDDLAYVLYTSGSTGRPKGVQVPHRALANFLWSMRRQPGCGEDDVLLAVTTLSFDIAALELFLPLTVGGRVQLASRSVAGDGARLRAALEESGATIMQATPATWRILIDAGWSGTPGLKGLCGGEGLPRELAAQLLERIPELWNMYGPTETTIWSSIQRISDPEQEITIGRPIANTSFFIVDKRLRPVPLGVPGELLIGGEGLATGYRNLPELTSQQFIPHPFSEDPDSLVYRTGDLVRYRADGQVAHLGRIDHQVKVRGFRIELGEVETMLDQHPSIQASVVTTADDHAGGRTLVAYLVVGGDHAPTVGELRRFLLQKLPDYMIPSSFVLMDALPLTPNGKVDRRALPAPTQTRPRLDSVFIEARTESEKALVDIWQDLLGVEQIGIHDDFFALGGNSLVAVKLVARIGSTFGITLPLRTLFSQPTVAELTTVIAVLVAEVVDHEILLRTIEELEEMPADTAIHEAGSESADEHGHG